MKERLSHAWSDVGRADRISFLVVGIVILIVNGVLIGLLF